MVICDLCNENLSGCYRDKWRLTMQTNQEYPIFEHHLHLCRTCRDLLKIDIQRLLLRYRQPADAKEK